jgi:hypothetical protein
MKTLDRSRAATVAALSLVLSVGMTVGCGGDSGGGPQDKFIGLWFNEAVDTTGFTMSCTDARLTSVFPATGAQFEIFGSLLFEHGELTDLAETSGNCNLLSYNIKGDTATVVDPDPYVDLDPPDNAAGCVVQFGIPTTSGSVLSAAALIAPTASWSAKLLSEKTAGGGDRLELSGTATATVFVDDGSAAGILSTPDCSYGGSDTFFRLTRP